MCVLRSDCPGRGETKGGGERCTAEVCMYSTIEKLAPQNEDTPPPPPPPTPVSLQIATPAAPPSRRTSSTPRVARTSRHVLTCKLDRLPARTLKRVVPLRPTTEKYLAFFGQTPFERRRKMINFLGGLFVTYWAAFFATRNVYVLGPGGINAIAWRGEGVLPLGTSAAAAAAVVVLVTRVRA